MSESKKTNESKSENAALSLREIERERSACREWLAANGGDKLTAEARETAEKSWLFRAEQQKKKPLLTPEERKSLLTVQLPHDLAQKISYTTGYTVSHDDPVLIAALGGVQLHEELLNRYFKLLSAFTDRMERYESNIQDAARLMSINAAMAAEMKTAFDKSAKTMQQYNESAAKLADKHGQILRVDTTNGDGNKTVLYLVAIVGFIVCALLGYIAAK